MLVKERKRENARWKQLGETDPYWAVITDEKYQAKAMTQEAKEEFFALGKTWITEGLAKVEKLFGPLEHKQRALDY